MQQVGQSAPSRFALATSREVRSAVRAELRTIPRARITLVASVALMCVGAWMGVLVPQLLGQIVDVVSQHQISGLGSGSLWRLSAGLCVAAVVGAVCNGVGFYLVAQLCECIIAQLRERLISTSLDLPVHEIEAAGTGDIVSRATDDIQEISTAVTQALPMLSTGAFAIVATSIAMLGLNPQYFLVVAIAALLTIWRCSRYLRVAPPRYAAERAAMALRARRVLETIRGKSTLDAYQAGESAQLRIGTASWDVVVRGLHARMALLVLDLWTNIIAIFLVVGALIVSFVLVDAGKVTLGVATASVLMMIRVRGPIMMLMRVLDVIQSGYASLARVIGITIHPVTPVPDAGAPPARGAVRLEHVSFAYGEGQWAVQDVDFNIAPGSTVALVGASGAGKTTVAALVAGLRAPDSGKVTVDGVSVTALSDDERRTRLAMVSQDVYVFSGTLAEDLRLAKPDATDEELLEALRVVRADQWFAQLADGLDTVVGAQGISLDPVAQQQLALARVLLLDPAVVVMDEATAESGSDGADALDLAAQSLAAGRTALIVAHRLDQAARADQIVVMDQGRIVEHGSHAELLSQQGSYAALWQAWQRGRA